MLYKKLRNEHGGLDFIDHAAKSNLIYLDQGGITQKQKIIRSEYLAFDGDDTARHFE